MRPALGSYLFADAQNLRIRLHALPAANLALHGVNHELIKRFPLGLHVASVRQELSRKTNGERFPLAAHSLLTLRPPRSCNHLSVTHNDITGACRSLAAPYQPTA